MRRINHKDRLDLENRGLMANRVVDLRITLEKSQLLKDLVSLADF